MVYSIPFTGTLSLSLSKKFISLMDTKVEEYARKLDAVGQSHTLYSQQRGATKAFQDNVLGKRGEFFAWAALQRFFDIHTEPPDLRVREGAHKGWQPDLLAQHPMYPSIHVKTCMPRDYGDSWTFQWANRSGVGGRDPLFTQGINDLVVGVHLGDLYSPSAEILVVAPFTLLVPHLRDPMKPSLVGLKKCLYFNDIKDHI